MMRQNFDAPENSTKEIGNRLKALRAQMHAHKLDAFLVPRSDAWQGEYVAPCDNRLAWISGFTGSAGLALIHKKSAELFTDGRYTLQAKNQTDPNLFNIHQAPPLIISNWLKENFNNKKIGFDPWLHPHNEIARYQKSGLTLKATNNLIDKIWTDRPPRNAPTIKPHPLKLAGEPSQKKRARISAKIANANADLCLITRPDSICWLLNIRGNDVPCTPLILSHALLHKNGNTTLFIRGGEVSPSIQKHLGNSTTINDTNTLIPQLKTLAKNKQRILIDANHAPHILAQAAGKHAQAHSDPCQLPKAIKNPNELKATQQAHITDGAALTKFLCWLNTQPPSKTTTEIDAVKQLESIRSQNTSFRDISFETIAGAGKHGAIVHYRVTTQSNRPLKQGELFLVDSGGQYAGGTTDITRTTAIGTPTARMRREFTAVLQGHIALAQAVFPIGTTGNQLDALARAPLWKLGLDYAHGTGHGVGVYLGVHEGPQTISPRAGATSPVALLEGMIISNEPGYYREGHYGIRIENLVVVRRAALAGMLCFETISFAPVDLSLVEVRAMAVGERAWLNAYHAGVRGVLMSHMETPAQRKWLANATRKI